MHIAAFATLAFAATAATQAVTQLIVPSSTPPASCRNSRVGTFSFEIVSANGSAVASTGGSVGGGASGSSPPSVSSSISSSSAASSSASRKHRRSLHHFLQERTELTLTLEGGILKDSLGRTGYIASNYQFQFDKPPQAGAIYTGGWSICPNGSLALGSKSVFWSCVSGSFSNLYDRDWAPAHCAPVYFYSADGEGAAFSTPPPVSASTGGDQPTITNGGDTQTQDQPAATTGFNAGSASQSSVSTTASHSTSASKGAGALNLDTDAPRTLLAWAMGAVGALAMV